MSAHHVPLKSSSGEEVFTTHGASEEGTQRRASNVGVGVEDQLKGQIYQMS